ncbi:hypothetical protein GGR54DRAFT_252482 [Hypoxylon sp. NC1633]|nr:hypothetical protein GGR54DRAFT_252482 [Hypoxylon sp. NC1633]
MQPENAPVMSSSAKDEAIKTSVRDASIREYGPDSILWRCLYCKAAFSDSGHLYYHQIRLGHMKCHLCPKSFITFEDLLAHKSEEHPVDQDLTCPGCRIKFPAASGWIQHIETNNCRAIFPSDLGNTAEIMKSLTDKMNLELGFSVPQAWGETPNTSTAKDGGTDQLKDEAEAQGFDVHRNPEAFPRIAGPESHQGNSNRSGGAAHLEQHSGNAWAQKKTLFSKEKASDAVRPPPSLVENLRQLEISRRPAGPTGPTGPTGQRILDPSDPGFNVALFKNPILDVYSCPHKGCNSKFKASKGLISHLNSPTHARPKFKCMRCEATFNCASAWARHAETIPLAKCPIRRTPRYGDVLKAISAGILGIDTVNVLLNDTWRVTVDQDWLTSRNRLQSPKPKIVPGSAKDGA